MNLFFHHFSIRILLLSFFLVLWSGAQAAGAAETSVAGGGDSQKPYGTVWKIKGDVFASAKPGAPRKLKDGATVYVGEQVRAAPQGEAVLKTGDAGMVAVRPGAEFVMERFAAEGKSTDHQIIRLITGSLRIISGWIGALNRNENRVVTPTATIGIRGTDHEPYVLPAELANATYRQGTYDKVNRGGTSLDTGEGSVVIDKGRVGFARDPNPAGGGRSRALMTLLLPVLLTKVPEFYVPGAFEQELDKWSEAADALSLQQLEARTGQKLAAMPKTADAPHAVTSTASPSAAAVAPQLEPVVGCPPQTIAANWLNQLDSGIARKDLKAILDLFATDITATATVRTSQGSKTLSFARDELVNSTLNSVSGLKNYQQRRTSIEAVLAEGETPESCKKIALKSVAIEQGLMNEKPYRFEALEEYMLELRDGQWQATQARTTQR